MVIWDNIKCTYGLFWYVWFLLSLAVQSPLNNISKQFGLRSDPKFYKERYFLKSYHDKKKAAKKSLSMQSWYECMLI